MIKIRYMIKGFFKKLSNKYWKPISWSYPYLFFASIVILIFLSVTLIFTFYCTFSAYQDFNKRLLVGANRIDKQLVQTFEETSHIMAFLGEKIVAGDVNDLNRINGILSNISKIKESIKCEHICWTQLNWVTPDKHVKVNSQHGVLEKPINVTTRHYIYSCPLHPGTLQLSKPAIGFINGLWIIPAGYGVLDSNGEYKGILVTGFLISELNFILHENLKDSLVSYLVINDEKRVVLSSSDNALDYDDAHFQEKLEKTNFKELRETPLERNGIIYTHSRKMLGYPFTILTGYNPAGFQREFSILVLPRLLEIWAVAVITLILFYLFSKKFITLTRASEDIKEAYLRNLHQEMKPSLNSILVYADICIRYLKGEIEVGIDKEKQIEFLEKIQEESFNLMTLTTKKLTCSFIDINQIIRHAVDIQTQAAAKRNITIRTILSPDLPFLYADELRLKQAIVGLLSLSLDYTHIGGNTCIRSYLKNEDEKSFIVIFLEDNGFSLDEKDIRRLSNRFEPIGDGIDLEYVSIEKLIKMHHGTCEIKRQGKRGKIIIVNLPCSLEAEDQAIVEYEEYHNVCKLNISNKTLIMAREDNI